jgi:hypothetical protein
VSAMCSSWTSRIGPGRWGEVAQRIGEAGVNIELVYTTFGAVRLVLGVDELDKARAAL